MCCDLFFWTRAHHFVWKIFVILFIKRWLFSEQFDGEKRDLRNCTYFASIFQLITIDIYSVNDCHKTTASHNWLFTIWIQATFCYPGVVFSPPCSVQWRDLLVYFRFENVKKINTAFEWCLVIDISRHTNKSHSNNTQTVRAQKAREYYIIWNCMFYANMWWIGFYSFQTRKSFFLFCFVWVNVISSLVFLLHCLVSMPNRKISTKNHELEENEIPLWMRLQWILVLDLDAKLFYFWCGRDWNVGYDVSNDFITINKMAIIQK